MSTVASSSSSMSSDCKHSDVTLVLDNGRTFNLSHAAAMQSGVLQSLLGDMEDVSAIGDIPIHNTTVDMLEVAISYMERKVTHPDEPLPTDPRELKRTDTIDPWDRALVADMPYLSVSELMTLANYLDIGGLLRLTGKTVANMVKGKTPEEIRQAFNIKNDFTPEEEARIRAEYCYT